VGKNSQFSERESIAKIQLDSRQLGLEEAPVIVLDQLSGIQGCAYPIADNGLAQGRSRRKIRKSSLRLNR
jgi:hypothetical protein